MAEIKESIFRPVLSDDLLKSLSPDQSLEEFFFFVPFNKSTTTVYEDSEGKRIIEGIASTEDKDLQNEKVIQKGIDLSYFNKHGTLNWDHKPEPQYIVGEPLDSRHTDKGLYLKGLLYKDHQIADGIWELAKSMEKSGSSRKLGFSIQGRVLRKSNGPSGSKNIESCWLQAIAVTAHPINTHTYLDVVKALSQEVWCDHSSGVCYSVSAMKSLQAGQQNPAVDDGSSQRVESLEANEKVQRTDKDKDEKDCACKGCTKKSMGSCSSVSQVERTICYADAVEYVENTYGYSGITSNVVAKAAFLTNHIVP